MDPKRKTSNNNALIVTVVLLALIAVAVYVLFANDADEMQPNDVVATQQPSQADLIKARTEIAVVLSDLQADINDGVNMATSTLNQKLMSERRELRQTYQNVTGQAKTDYEAIDRDLGRLETELKGDVKVASATIGGIMGKLEADMEAGARATWNEVKRAAASMNDTTNQNDTTIEVSGTTSAEIR